MEFKCECDTSVSGLCPLHNIIKSRREKAICNGEGIKDSVRNPYLIDWQLKSDTFEVDSKDLAKPKKSRSVKRPTKASDKLIQPATSGHRYIGAVGTKLKKILQGLGISETSGCGCNSKAKMMDQKGIGWCRDNFETLQGWLVESALTKVEQSKYLSFIPSAVIKPSSGIAAKTLLTKAIHEASIEINNLPQTQPAIGITTAPRPHGCLLGRCVSSVIESGFYNVTVYSEPGLEINGCLPFQVGFVRRSKKLGAWHNWMQTLEDLLKDNPDSNTIMIVQDDTVFCKQIPQFLKQILWPSYDCSAIQLCCSTGYRSFSSGINKMPGTGMLGAWATVMHRYWAQQILDYGKSHGWRGHHKKTITDPVKRKAIDDYIGYASERLGGKCYIVNPSCVLHDADFSTLNHGDSKGKRNNRKTRSPIKQNQVALDYIPVPRKLVQFS